MNRPTVHELECFVAIAEELSFSKAAKRLRLSQPPLSRQLRSLESKLAARLLNRSTRVVTLTDAGRLYLEDAKQVLARLDSSSSMMRRAASGELQRLRLAFVGALADDALVRQLQAFRALHPECQVHMVDLAPSEQIEALLEGQVDGAFIGVSPLKLSQKLKTQIWKREPLNAVLPDTPHHAKSASLKLAQLKSESWIMVSEAAAPAFRQHLRMLCRNAKFQPAVIQESDRVAAVLTMVAAGQGVSLLPAGLSRLLKSGVVFKPLSDPKATLAHAFAVRRHDENGMVPAFAALLRSAKG